MEYNKRAALGDLLEAVDSDLPPDQKVAWWIYAGENTRNPQLPDVRHQPDDPTVYGR